MSADARQVIAAVLVEHRPGGMDCKCGEPINSDQGWANHLAAEIDAELGGLTRESTWRRVAGWGEAKLDSRWVSGWAEDTDG